jgi:hypothetical protein
MRKIKFCFLAAAEQIQRAYYPNLPAFLERKNIAAEESETL